MLVPLSILSSRSALIGTESLQLVRKILIPRPWPNSYHNRTQLRTRSQLCSPRPLGYIPIKSPLSAPGTPCPCALHSHTTPNSINIHPLAIPIPSPQAILNGVVNCLAPLPLQRLISFGRNCLLLLTENSKIVEFPFPTAADGLIEARGFGLRPASGSHFFTRPSHHGLGHKHPIRSSTPNPPPPLPLPAGHLASYHFPRLTRLRGASAT